MDCPDDRRRIRGRDSGEILIAGLGSIGRRHLQNLQTLGWRRIRLYRTGRATLFTDDAALAALPVDDDLGAALAERPLAVIISNPPALHVPVALEAARAGAHLLIEKPLSHDLEGIDALEAAVASQGLAALVGFHLRFNPGLRQIKRWIDTGALGTVVSVQAHWGEYVPGMHPWEDYRLGCAGQAALGGGVLLTLCHPFDYLRWLVGDVDCVSAVESRRDSLGLRVDTCVDVALRFVCGASAHVHLDFLQRPTEHHVVIIGTEGTATWSHRDHAARRYSAFSAVWETAWPPDSFERNRMFLDEMRHFLGCLQGEERPLCTLGDGKAALEIVLAAKRAVAAPSIPVRRHVAHV